MFKSPSGRFYRVFAGRGNFGGWLIAIWSEYGLIGFDEVSTATLRTLARSDDFAYRYY